MANQTFRLTERAPHGYVVYVGGAAISSQETARAAAATAIRAINSEAIDKGWASGLKARCVSGPGGVAQILSADHFDAVETTGAVDLVDTVKVFKGQQLV